jgi:small-conductance mechanosensitive channel
MTRLDDLGVSARGAGAAPAERAFAVPVHAAPAFVSSAFVTGLAAAITALLGLPLAAVFAITLATALACVALAHRTFANLFAGWVLLLVRPYGPGEKLRLFSPVRGCSADAEIVRIGLANTTLATTSELIVVPNTQLLKSTPQPDEPPPCW